MRLALYGGSFNPPHVAHQLTCLYVLETARPRFDALWVLPAWQHAFDKPLAPWDDRVEMCERLVAPLGPRVCVSRLEGELGGASYTLRTVREVMAHHAGVEISLVIGSDLVAELPLWHGYDELRSLVHFHVVGRAGAGPDADLVMPRVSSSDVRARVAAGADVSALLPTSVSDYIRERGLYGAARSA